MPLDPQMASLFSDLDPHHHRAQRRKFAAAYSMSALVGYEQFVDNCSSVFICRMREIADCCERADFAHWFQCYAFDVIGEITFGQRFGFLDMGVDKDGVFGAIETRSAYSTFIGIFPLLHRFLFPLLPKSGGHGYIGNYTANQISRRENLLKNPSSNNHRNGPADFVSKFLQIHEKNPKTMTRTDIFTICQSNIGAGSDTTAITLSSILYYLLKHPLTYQRLQKEIDIGIADGIVSDPITFKEARSLPYLQAVIKEALRLHPATGLPLARVVPANGVTIAGMHFPGGATVGINSWVAHHNTSIYGPDAHLWRPERWLEFNQDGRGGEIERYFFAFGMGSRTCIGKNLSLLEVSTLIPQLLRQFDFTLASHIQQSDWTDFSRWFVKPQNFEGYVKLRKLCNNSN
jgi:cytochrome P450